MTALNGPIEAQEPPEEGARWALLRALFDSPVTIFAVAVIVLVLLMAVVGEFDRALRRQRDQRHEPAPATQR